MHELIGHETRPGVTFHPQAPGASVERVRQLAGIISLTGPVPSWKFMDEVDREEAGADDEDQVETDHAGH